MRNSVLSSYHQFYSKYKEVLLFNKNILIAAVASIIADAMVVQYIAQTIGNNGNVIVTIFSAITDTGVYLATFAIMFLIDNRNKYRNTAAKTKENSARLKSDIKKLITALGVSEAVYIFVKFTSIYIVLQSHTTYPYQAAILTTLLAWIFYIITANAMVKYQKMFKHNEAS